MDKEGLRYLMALQDVPKVGPIVAKNLIAYCGSAAAVFNEKRKALEAIPGIGAYLAQALNKPVNWQKIDNELAFLERHNINAVSYLEAGYPHRLKEAEDAPILLFFKGKGVLNAPRAIGVVGTRHATPYGKDVCRNIIAELKPYGVQIISGLAHGIDTAAHKAALENEMSTIGAMATGLHTIFPAGNRNLAIKMLEQGGLITEYWSQTPGKKEHFPARNRIIAGMIDCLLVVETAVKGGAMITAALAMDYDRDVYALPGRAGDLYSEGCNHLIRNQRATLVTSAEHIAYHMGWDTEQVKPAKILVLQDLSPDERKLTDILKMQDSVDIDSLMLRAEMSSARLNLLLLEMEMKDLIQGLPGKRYRLTI